MAKADTDGRVAQMVSDMLALLGIEMNESIRENRAAFNETLKNLAPVAADTTDGGDTQ